VAQDRRTFDLSLVTPEGPAFEGEVEMLVVPGAAGEIGVLARHAPLVATLKAGGTRVYIRREEEEIREFATGPGFFKVEQDRALALVDDAVDAAHIDPERARKQLEEAQAELDRLERGESDADRWQLEQRIAHAQNQLDVYGGGGGGRIRPVAPPAG
jgi:F-type H+-transporting ATPase subunit epsilon